MTIPNDPNLDRTTNAQRRANAEGWGTNTIVLGALAALAVVIGIYYMTSNRNPTVATTDRPAVSTTAPVTTPAQPRTSETTGSGATTVTPPLAAPSTTPPTAR